LLLTREITSFWWPELLARLALVHLREYQEQLKV
jgi:hypothetical protein